MRDAIRLDDVTFLYPDERAPVLDHVTLVVALAAPLRWLAPVLDDVTAFLRATPPAVF